MKRSTPALVNHELLKCARITSSFTVVKAAEKLHIQPELLEEWETGVSLPTFNQLLAISEAYKRPVSLFYLEKPPKGFMTLRDYRRLPDTVNPLSESPQLSLEIRKAYSR